MTDSEPAHELVEQDSNQNDNLKMPIMKQIKPRLTNNSETENNVSNIAKSKTSDTQLKGDENIQYLTGEMRQKHLRLKKLEQDLKLKEKLIQDTCRDKTRLETRLLQLESQNDELMSTIRTLKRKIAVLEETNSPRQTQPVGNCYIKPPPTPENELMTNIHSKVTRYILKQVDIQLEKLGDSCNTDNVKTMDHNIATQTSCSKQNTCNEAATQTTENDNRVNLNAVNDKNHIVNYPVIQVPTNTHTVQSLSGPPIHYMPMSINSVVAAKQHVNRSVIQNPTANSRTPWSTASKRKFNRENRGYAKKDNPVLHHQNKEKVKDFSSNKQSQDVNVEADVIIIDEGVEHTDSFFRDRNGEDRPEIVTKTF